MPPAQGEPPWTPLFGLESHLDAGNAQLFPNRDFMVRSVLHNILSLQGAGRDLRRYSEARLGAGREEANGCNCGVVNRAGRGVSWGPGEEGVAWCPERVVGIFGERQVWQLPAGEGVCRKDGDVQKRLMGVSIGTVMAELFRRFRIQDQTVYAERWQR